MKQEQESFSPESKAFSSFSFTLLLISAKALIDSCIIPIKKKDKQRAGLHHEWRTGM
jgi:hypothetical protein